VLKAGEIRTLDLVARGEVKKGHLHATYAMDRREGGRWIGPEPLPVHAYARDYREHATLSRGPLTWSASDWSVDSRLTDRHSEDIEYPR
jgi:hypothetical protein